MCRVRTLTGRAGGCLLLLGALVSLSGGRDGGAVSRSVGVFPVTGGDIDRQAVGDVAAQRTRDAGFDLHLTKPTDPETLVQMLAKLAA